MPVAPSEVVRVTHRLLVVPGGFIQNVYHFRNDSGETLDNTAVLDDFDDWATALEGDLDDMMVDSATFVDASVFNVSTGQPVGVTVTGGLSGILAEDPLPSGVAALITLETGVKRAIGKKFYGGLSESLTTAGVLNATAVGHLTDVVDWILGVQTFNLHEWTPGVWRDALNVFYPFITALIRTTPAYQRRRKSGVGS